ncbi:MAG: hypothetical protein ACRCX2_14675 [Paraclostridium sp.]
MYNIWFLAFLIINAVLALLTISNLMTFIKKEKKREEEVQNLLDALIDKFQELEKRNEGTHKPEIKEFKTREEKRREKKYCEKFKDELVKGMTEKV